MEKHTTMREDTTKGKGRLRHEIHKVMRLGKLEGNKSGITRQEQELNTRHMGRENIKIKQEIT